MKKDHKKTGSLILLWIQKLVLWVTVRSKGLSITHRAEVYQYRALETNSKVCPQSNRATAEKEERRCKTTFDKGNE